MRRVTVRAWAAASLLALSAGTASATWSIVIVDTRTGEIAAASATCLTSFDLQANTPVLLTGVGAATAQSSVDADSTNRTFIREGFLNGTAPSAILTGLAGFDNAHQTRQYGLVDARGRAATFSGTSDGKWAGGRTGSVGTLVYAVQGNVLAGAPVVDAAVAAIENTPGDMPAKLMAAMEAARFYGGDGRCSCSQSMPDSCGSPPPTFTKAAHIAYMLIARAGDADGTNPAYKAGNSSAVVVGDFNGDGLPDLASGGDAAASITVFTNISKPGGAVRFAAGYKSLIGPAMRDLAAADFDGDGRADLAGSDGTNDRVMLFKGKPDGTFPLLAQYAVGDNPIAVAAADFSGDGTADLAVANAASKTVSLLYNSGGVLVAQPVISVGSTIVFLQAGDLDHDGDTDLVVGVSAPNAIAIYRNAGGTFTRDPDLTWSGGAGLQGLWVGDVDLDGRADIGFTLTSDTQARLARSTAGGFVVSAITVGSNPRGLVFRDVTNDGRADLVCTLASGNLLSVVPQLPDGTFGTRATYPIGFGRSRLALADLNADGNLDAVLPGGPELVMPAKGPGVFNPQSGLGGGDFFMTFNVPNQKLADPDPVFTLRSMFDAWRTTLTGTPDAVASLASFDRPIVRANGRETTTLTVRLRDYAGTSVHVPASALEVIAKNMSPLATHGTVSENPDGSLSVTFTAGESCGVDRYDLRVTGAFRPVVLMPEASIEFTSAADMNADGFLTGDDYDAFVDLFLLGDPGADFDGNGSVTGDDFDAFVLSYEKGC